MNTHTIACYSDRYQNVVDGIKTFMIKVNDKDYTLGDILHLREYSKDKGHYLGRESLFEVTYIDNVDDHYKSGFVAMAIRRFHPYKWRVKGLDHYYVIDEKDRRSSRIWKVGDSLSEVWRVEVWGKFIDDFDHPYKAKLAAEVELFLWDKGDD